MTSNDPCPRCGKEIILVDPTEEVWLLNPSDYVEDEPQVWLCTACNWNEEATDDEIMDEATANIEWVLSRLAEAS